MRLLCFIDSLGAGGAQRQLTTLAVGLKRRGHDVRFLVYHPHDHFLPLLQTAGIPCEVIPACSHFQRLWAVRRILRRGWQEAVLAFLTAPCFYAELARFPGRHWGLVAGERLADPAMKSGAGRWVRQFHRLADTVVCNSHTNRLMVEAVLPFLSKKLATVYNIVDLSLFHCPSPPIHGAVAPPSNVFRIVVAASYHEKKNMLGLAKALHHLRTAGDVPPIVIDWFGAVQPDPTPYHRAQQFVAENGLAELLRFHPPTRALAEEYSRADAVGLFSFFEGLPNAICEGMACGKPIVLSNVCDAGNLVRQGKNGFLCDPSSPESIACALRSLAAGSQQERRQMGLESRKMAENLFGEDVIVERYERLLQAAIRRQAVPAESTWPVEVPESAVGTVDQWATAGARGR